MTLLAFGPVSLRLLDLGVPEADARLAMLPRPHLRLSRPKPWGPTGRLGPARPPTHDARSVGAVKAYPSSVSVTVVRAVRSLADSTLLS